MYFPNHDAPGLRFIDAAPAVPEMRAAARLALASAVVVATGLVLDVVIIYLFGLVLIGLIDHSPGGS